MLTEEEYAAFEKSGGDKAFLAKFMKLDAGEEIDSFEKASTVYGADSDDEETQNAQVGMWRTDSVYVKRSLRVSPYFVGVLILDGHSNGSNMSGQVFRRRIIMFCIDIYGLETSRKYSLSSLHSALLSAHITRFKGYPKMLHFGISRDTRGLDSVFIMVSIMCFMCCSSEFILCHWLLLHKH